MKQVVIGVKAGKPYIVSCPKKIQVLFKVEKRRSFRKMFRTWVYRIKRIWM